MSLNLALLENAKNVKDGLQSACPACREVGKDKDGVKLLVYANGAYNCIAVGSGEAHNKRIYELAGDGKAKEPVSQAKLEELERLKAKAESDRRRGYERVADAMSELCKRLPDADASHPYILRKELMGAHGLRLEVDGGIPKLVVPLEDIDGRVWSVQRIWQKQDGGFEKLYAAGGRTQGRFHPFGDWKNSPVIIIAEGWATAAAIYGSTGIPTIAAMHCGNLLPVARNVNGACPMAGLVFAADNDAWDKRTGETSKKNTGVDAAEKAAKAFPGSVVAVPRFKNHTKEMSDFCDLMGTEGDEEVDRQITTAMTMKPPRQEQKSPGGLPASPSNSLHQPEKDGFTGSTVSQGKAGGEPNLTPVDEPPAPPTPESDQAEIQRLAALTLLEYEREKARASKRLGCGIPTLDKLVKDLRAAKSARNGVAAGYLPQEGEEEDPPPSIYGGIWKKDSRGKVTDARGAPVADLLAQTGDWLHDRGEGRIYRYNPAIGIWEPQTPDTVHHALRTECIRVDQQLATVVSTSALRDAYTELKGMVDKRAPFASRPNFLAVANGTLDMRSGTPVLVPHDRGHMLRAASSVPWIPGATCSRFLEQLLAPVLSKDDIGLVQRVFGQCLLGLNFAQVILLAHGPAGTGKGTLLRLLKLVVGLLHVGELRTHMLSTRFEIGRLYGKSIAIGWDVPGDFLEEDGAYVLKSLVGGDAFDGEAKGSNGTMPIDGTLNVIIAANTRLRVRLDGDRTAWARRLLMVEFGHAKTAKPVKDFERVLMAEEGPGILAWAVEGLRLAMLDMEATGRLTVTPEQQERVTRLLEESDALPTFVREHITACEGGSLSSAEFLAAFCQYCTDHGYRLLPSRIVELRAPDLMLEFHGEAHSKTIQRESGKCRGWRNVSCPEAQNTEETL